MPPRRRATYRRPECPGKRPRRPAGRPPRWSPRPPRASPPPAGSQALADAVRLPSCSPVYHTTANRTSRRRPEGHKSSDDTPRPPSQHGIWTWSLLLLLVLVVAVAGEQEQFAGDGTADLVDAGSFGGDAPGFWRTCRASPTWRRIACAPSCSPGTR